MEQIIGKVSCVIEGYFCVFPCGYTIGRDGDSINIYYGAADTSIALATSSIRQMLEWLEEHGK